MVNYYEAHSLISAWLLDQSTQTNIELELVELDTIEVDFGGCFSILQNDSKTPGISAMPLRETPP